MWLLCPSKPGVHRQTRCLMRHSARLRRISVPLWQVTHQTLKWRLSREQDLQGVCKCADALRAGVSSLMDRTQPGGVTRLVLITPSPCACASENIEGQLEGKCSGLQDNGRHEIRVKLRGIKREMTSFEASFNTGSLTLRHHGQTRDNGILRFGKAPQLLPPLLFLAEKRRPGNPQQ